MRMKFCYMAVSIPQTPASSLRLDSYRLGIPLPPPEFDSLGYTSKDVRLAGNFGNEPFNLECTVSGIYLRKSARRPRFTDSDPLSYRLIFLLQFSTLLDLQSTFFSELSILRMKHRHTTKL